MSTNHLHLIARKNALHSSSLLRTLGILVVVFGMVVIPAPALNVASAVSQHPASTSQATTISSSTTITPFAAPDFSLTTNPTSITMSPGTSQTVQVTANSLNSFAGKVYLSAFGYPPKVSLNQTDLTLSSGGSASATLTATFPASFPPINGTIFIESVGGCSLFHEALVSVIDIGPDFTVRPEKTHLTVTSSIADSTTIDLTSLHGFSGTVTLDAFTPEFMITPPFATVTLGPGGQGSTTMSFLAASTTTPGNYTVTIFASSGSIFEFADVDVTVSGATFGLSANLPVLSLTAGGASNSSTITVTPVGSFSGSVSLSPSPSSPSGLNVLPLSTSSVTLPPAQTSTLTVSAPSGTRPGHYSVEVTATSGLITESVTVSIHVKGPDFELTTIPFVLAVVAGDTTGCQSTISDLSIDGFSSSVALTVKHDAGLSATLSASSLPTVGSTSILTVTAAANTVPTSYEVDVNGTSGILTHTDLVTVFVIGPDFEISANPPDLTITAGSSMTTSISLHAENGFTGTVSLHNSTFGPGIAPTLSSSTISGTSTVTLTVAVASSALPGDYYSVEVNATSGALNHPIFIAITVVGPDFAITTDKSPVTFNAGSTSTSTITINPLMGFSDPVALFVGGSFDLNATIDPTMVTSGSYTATLSLNSTKPGYYTLEVFGSTSSGLFHYLTIPVVVSGPDFSLSASPPTVTIAAGASGTSSISVGTVLGFTGKINLSSVFPPTGITAVPTPTSITESQTSTVQITVDPSVAPGPYTVDIQGTSGSLKHDALITVNVAGFALSATPATVTIYQGSSGTSTINVASLNGFSNKVDLTTSPAIGLTATILPTSVTGSGPSTLTIQTNSVSPGTYQVDVTGTSGLLSVKTTITVTVPSRSPTSTEISCHPSTVQVGDSFTCTATVTDTSSTGATAPAGTVNFTPTNTCTLIYPLSKSASCSVTYVASISYGDLMISGTYVPGTSDNHVTSTGSFAEQVTDFGVTMSMPTSAVADGVSTATSTVFVSEINGFTGSVVLTYAFTPTGISCAFSSSTITNSGTSTISCTSTTVNSYQVTVTGTAGTLKHTTAAATFTFTAVPTPDFAISAASPLPVAADGHSVASSTVSVTYENGYSGTVTLADTPLPSALSCTLTPTSRTSTGTASLSCTSSTAGTYTVHIMGTGSTTHTATATFTFNPLTSPSFSVSSDHTALSIPQGSSGTATITVTSSGGFSNSVTLTSSVSPSGPTMSFSNPTIISGSGTSILTINVASGVNTGTYTVTVTGGSGGQAKNATITVTVTAPQPAATSPFSPALVYGIIGIVIAAIAIGGSALYLRTKKPSKPAEPAKTAQSVRPSNLVGSH